MNNNNSESDLNISESTHLYHSKRDIIEDDDEEIKKNRILPFFILVIFIFFVFIFVVITVVYKFIIKPESEESNRKNHPEIYISLRERNKIDKYVRKCLDGILLDDKKYKKSENPKISIILPVYNKQNFILRVLRSIQNQSFKDIEIIFCDDHSYDNSTNLIEMYQKEDERIILLKQDTNKGTLQNRIAGAFLSKGEYILFVDPDDLLIEFILETAYSKAKKYNVDIVQFQSYNGYFEKSFSIKDTNHSTTPIYQPELSNFMYYEKGYLSQTEFFIWGKLIRRNIFIEAINSIDKYFLNQHMTLHEDGLTLFILFKKANSYLFIKDYGTFYYYNDNSTLSNLSKRNNINKTVRNCFLYLEFMFHNTNDTLYEKNMAVFQFKSLLNQYGEIYKKVSKGFDYIYKVIDLYLNCNIILEEDKKIILSLKQDIKSIELNSNSLE